MLFKSIKWALILIGIINNLFLFSQEVSIQGRLWLEHTNAPLNQVKISVIEIGEWVPGEYDFSDVVREHIPISNTAISNEQGGFELNLHSQADSMVFRFEFPGQYVFYQDLRSFFPENHFGNSLSGDLVLNFRSLFQED